MPRTHSYAAKGAMLGFGYGAALSRMRPDHWHTHVGRTVATTAIGAGVGYGIAKARGGEHMARKANTSKMMKGASQKASNKKGIGGATKAQGSTPKKISRPVDGVKKFGGAMKKGTKSSVKKGGSPLDGRGKKTSR